MATKPPIDLSDLISEHYSEVSEELTDLLAHVKAIELLLTMTIKLEAPDLAQGMFNFYSDMSESRKKLEGVKLPRKKRRHVARTFDHLERIAKGLEPAEPED